MRSIRRIIVVAKCTVSKRYRVAFRLQRLEKETYEVASRITAQPRVLIVCEASIPQCFRYRVENKQKALSTIGIMSTWVSWQETRKCLELLQTHSVAIFYRTPLFPGVEEIYREAERLQIRTFWEVDDLIFDAKTLKRTPTLQHLDKRTFRGLIKGADFYLGALCRAEIGIASTDALATEMKRATGREAIVIHNALDRSLIRATEAAREISEENQGSDQDTCTIVYGSGTNTHNIDFLEASDALLGLLNSRPLARLRIIGHLTLPAGFEGVHNQIELLGAVDFEKYIRLLSECQISIAPLEATLFNECKSNIKWLEASALEIPTIASGRAEFRNVITNGLDGYICNSMEDWKAALETLVDNRLLREAMGQRAKIRCSSLLGQERVAALEVDQIRKASLDRVEPDTVKRPMRILSLNIYYGPRSFGGATVVAEGLNGWLVESSSAEVGVFCLIPDERAKGKGIHRYSFKGVQVYGIPETLATPANDAPPDASSMTVLNHFSQVLEAFKPDVIHVHSIQRLGIDLLDIARANGIPYIISLHDAWWLCPLQFMLTPEGVACNQWKIEPEQCISCTGRERLVQERNMRMKTCLNGASLLLAPSQYSESLYRANGYTNIRLNRNGVHLPEIRRTGRHSEGPVIFGYLGGNVAIKGFKEIQKVFRELREDDGIGLTIVDNTVNLGHSSFYRAETSGINNIQVVPGFRQEDSDAFYGQIDVLLFPTRCRESFGLTIREALARGIWVITSDAGGAVEDIRDGANGRIIPFLDDGRFLYSAVLEAKEKIREFRSGVKDYPRSDVRSIAAQAEELAGILEQMKESR